MSILKGLPARWLAFVLFCMVFSTRVSAVYGEGDTEQVSGDLCPSFVTQALDATETTCKDTARNQLCYGHNLLSVEPQNFVSQLAFNVPGDIVPVTQIRSVRGSALDLDNASWGVAVVRLQADLPDSLPNQNVTLLLFGDTQITDAADHDLTTITVETRVATNLRSGPASRYPVLSSVGAGAEITATGRLADSSWLRVGIPGQDNQIGWLFASLVTSEVSDFGALQVVDPSNGTPSLGPLSAFYLTTNETNSACEELPASGLVIQTPEGAGTVRLYINEIQVDIGSTVFFQANPEGALTVSTLEGMARVEVQGQTEVAAAGSQLTVPLDANLAPAGPPSMPAPYAENAFQALPTSNLERPIEVAPPLSNEAIHEVHDQVQNAQPVCGVGPLLPCSTIMMEGVVEAIGPDTITVNGMVIALAADNPLRQMLMVGTRVRIEGNLSSNGAQLTPTKLIIQAAPPNNPPPQEPPGAGPIPPAMGDPAMGDPGMGMGDPAMGDTGMGMGDPGMGDEGMGMGMGNP